MTRKLIAAAVMALFVGCSGAAPGSSARPAIAASAVPPRAAVTMTPAADPLGPRPATAGTPPFAPPIPDVFTSNGGMTVWLVERHHVPLVSCDLTLPAGASSDPKGKAGLAYVTAGMLDEGAGGRGAIELARALDNLGARLNTDTNADASFVSLTVLKRNLVAAFSLFADVVARPRFEPGEFKRVRALWINQLLQRQKDPDATARVVYRAALFGADHPYGHPWDGTSASAKLVTLDDVRRTYARDWRPDRATLVCAGDITRAEMTRVLDASFGSWKSPVTPPPPIVVPPMPKGPWPKLVLVDRPNAPQAVIAAVKPGIAASHPDEPVLSRVNDAIGGSFTSRLNQDLREERGYTYGARSRYSVSRGPGQVVSWANVVTGKTGDALGALLEDLRKFADQGLTGEEVERTRSQARGELVSVYESVESIAGHLAADASLGLGRDWQAKASERRDTAEKPALDALAKQFYDPAEAIVVVVGPREVVQPLIEKAGFPAPELRDADGDRLK